MDYIDQGQANYKTSGPITYTVHDLPELDGGGRRWGWEFPLILRQVFPDRVFEKCFDWCSGPGYCGFEMLSNKICRTLVLGDIHPPAIEYANRTINDPNNNCRDIVKSYKIERVADLPKTEKFDLVIGNPPHTNAINPRLDWDQTRILSDVGWNTHREFFDSITEYLTDDGVILLNENASPGAGPRRIFEPMIDKNGLKTIACIRPKEFDIVKRPYYYLVITRAN